jgi:hypothetical protein
VNAALLLGEGRGCGRVLLARAVLARAVLARPVLARTIAAVTVAAAAVAPSPALLFALAFGLRTLTFGRELMELRRLAS